MILAAEKLRAADLIAVVLDDGSFRSWDEAVPQGDVTAAYAGQLAEAAVRSGTDESLLTGEGTVRGRRVAVAVSEFGFLGGSIGQAAAGRLVAALERATREGLPMLAAPSSGGTRMQEGTPAFVEMVAITAAVTRHKAAGLPYLVYLRNPTTGGVMASWGSLGHLTIAEPGALLGFLGPKVYEALHGEPFPAGVQTAEHLFERGIVDGVVPAKDLPELLDRALRVLSPAPATKRVPQTRFIPPPADPWDSVLKSRDRRRPGAARFLQHAADDVVPLNGTGQGEAASGLLLALANVGGTGCVVLGQDRLGQLRRPLGPEAFRVARRGMRLAQELGLPLLTVIDTPGAALSRQAEEGGLAGEIARCVADLLTLDAPSVAVLLGQGCGGGALALLPANRVIAAEHAWLSPLPLEGASVIMHRTPARAAEMARQQRIAAPDLLAAGIIDVVVPELPDAAREAEAFCRRLGEAVRGQFAELSARSGSHAPDRMRRYGRLSSGAAPLS